MPHSHNVYLASARFSSLLPPFTGFLFSNLHRLSHILWCPLRRGLCKGACTPSLLKYPCLSAGYHPRGIVVAAIHGALPDPHHGIRHLLVFLPATVPVTLPRLGSPLFSPHSQVLILYFIRCYLLKPEFLFDYVL